MYIIYLKNIFRKIIVYNSKYNETLLTIHQNIVLVFQVLASADGKANSQYFGSQYMLKSVCDFQKLYLT